MKKLMIMAAVAVAAIMTHAATITWGSGAMYFAEGKTNPGDTSSTKLNATTNKGSGSLYYLANEDAYNSILATIIVSDTYSTDGAVKIYNEAKKGTYGDAAKTANSTKTGSISLDDGLDKTDGVTYYGLVVYEITSGDNTYVIANVGKYEMGPTSNTMDNMGLSVNGSVATSWANSSSAAPEPTSGVLLLLGMAGLALKRKRA